MAIEFPERGVTLMDPNEALKRLRQAIKVFRAADANAEAAAEGDSNDAEIEALQRSAGAGAAVVELAEALDDWITQGGFLPDDWRR